MVSFKLPPSPPPRNPLVVPALKKKAGKHGPSPGGERKRANDAARKEGASLRGTGKKSG